MIQPGRATGAALTAEQTISLEDYIRDQLESSKAEVESIGQAAKRVLSTFHHAFDLSSKAWPYKVDSGRQVAANPDKYSYSTNSMIGFALSPLLRTNPREKDFSWRKPVALLTPMLARLDGEFEIGEELANAATTTFLELERRLVSGTGSVPLTESVTFGNNDPFSLCWILESLPTEKLNNDKLLKTLIELTNKALNAPDKAALDLPRNTATAHALPLVRWLQLHERLRQITSISAHKLPELTDLGPVKDWLEQRLHQHLSYSTIPDSSFDAPELLFCMEGVLICEPSPQGLRRVLERVIDVLRETQEHNPNLRPYRPYVSDERGMSLLPVTIEVFLAMLRILERLSEELDIRLDGAREIVKRYAEWLLGQQTSIRTASGQVLWGWHSEHTHVVDCLHVWETSQVLLFLVHYRAWLQSEIQRDLLDVASFSVKKVRLDDWMPKSREACVENEPSSKDLYVTLWDYYIHPRRGGTSKPRYSILLYGPPGTGKTTIAEFIAASLDWELLTITPSDFIRRGEQLVEARARAIFQALMELKDKVVLFDEIDRLLLDRDSTFYQEQMDIFQFMTPSMLPKIRDLRQAKRCIFVIATNYAERIDPAIKRPGRIDDLLLLPPPYAKQRERFFTRQLDKDFPDWRTAGTDKPLQDIVAKTVLYSYPGLIDAIKHSFDPKSTAKKALATLSTYVKRTPPEMSVRAYAPRFSLNEKAEEIDRKTNQMPVTEFLHILEILTESNPDAENELLIKRMVEIANEEKDRDEKRF